jgi:hypothetical protein
MRIVCAGLGRNKRTLFYALIDSEIYLLLGRSVVGISIIYNSVKTPKEEHKVDESI